jgi:hypothetical protein
MGLATEESGSAASRGKGISLLQNVQTAFADLLKGIKGGRAWSSTLSAKVMIYWSRSSTFLYALIACVETTSLFDCFHYPYPSVRSTQIWEKKDDAANKSTFKILGGGGGRRGAARLRRCTTNRKVAGSIPSGVTENFHWHNPSGRTMALGSTQPLTEMSTKNIFWG